MNKKIKVLAYCDSPTCATGFGTVSRNIFEALYRTGRYDIDVLGINYWGDPHNFPYRIWPTGTNAQKDPYGRQKICSMIPNMEFDLLFFLQDTFILDFLPELMSYLKNKNKKFKSICYYPIDGVPKPKWIQNVSVVDYLVAYSKFGKDQSMGVWPEYNDAVKNARVIPHGVNTSDYFMLSDEETSEFKEKYFGINKNKFIITNVNRNQQRKDIPRTLQAFAEFRKLVPESLLYLHMAQVDQGWDLPEVCKSFGFNTRTDVVFPENFGPNQGYPREVVNMLYNISDCVVSTTLGEGFGLSWLEAMATKTPVIMPDNTMFGEFITPDLGWLVKSGTTPSLKTILPHDNEVIRPLVDVEDVVKVMYEMYTNKEERARRVDNAYKWVTSKMDWQGPIAKEWVGVFDNAYKELNTKTEVVVPENKLINTEMF